jgi:hypothetical protein
MFFCMADVLTESKLDSTELPQEACELPKDAQRPSLSDPISSKPMQEPPFNQMVGGRHFLPSHPRDIKGIEKMGPVTRCELYRPRFQIEE